MKKHVSITVHGKVQKVGFRFSAIDKAIEWELVGEVKNYEADKVQIEVEGEEENLQKFLKWCHVGPQGAVIEKVDYTSTEELQNYETFKGEW